MRKAMLATVVLVVAVPALGFGRDVHVGPHDSVQAAVDSASAGDVVYVSGTHSEQVIVTKDLALVGEAGATLTAPPGGMQTFTYIGGYDDDGVTPQYSAAAGVVTVYGANATVAGFTIDGLGMLRRYHALNGVAFIRGGGAVRDCAIRGIDDAGALLAPGDDFVSAGGQGVAAVNDLDDVREVVIQRCTITHWDSFGIGASGIGDDAHAGVVRVRVTADDNTVVGAGASNMHAQWGLIAFRGAVGTFRRNHVSDLIYTGQRWQSEPSTGLHGRYGDRYDVEDNVFTNVQVGIHIGDIDGAVTVRGNTVTAFGLPMFAPNGIFLWGDNEAVDVERNDVTMGPYQGALVISGPPAIGVFTGTPALVANNTVAFTLHGPANADIHLVPIGIQVRADGTTISGNQVTGPGIPSSAGILVDGSGCSVTGNTLAAVSYGIAFDGASESISDNRYSDVAQPVVAAEPVKNRSGFPPGGCGPYARYCK